MVFRQWFLFIIVMLSGCSTTQEIEQKDKTPDDEFTLHEPDPLELYNRYMYGFNRILDAAIIKPVAIMYKGLPDNVQYCTRSFVNNVYGPINLLNYTLQGRLEEAGKTAVRFILNSTFGLLGLLDFADFVGIKGERTSFNETLASWGVESGPYIMLPIIGPTTFRGAFGYAFDWFADPMRYVASHSKSHLNNHHQFKYWLWGVTAMDVIDIRASLIDHLDDIDATSPDPYVTIRSMIFQKQKKLDEKHQKDNDK